MRKFANVPAILAGILFLYANSASAGGTSQTSGRTTFYNFGGVNGTSQTIGRTTFYNGALFGN